MDGAIFDITERRANEEALRRHEVERARVEELRASQARIIEAADAARRRIERDLHDGAQQHLVALALEVRLARARAERDPHVRRRLPGARRRGARAGLGRAARAGPRHPSRRPHRARARAAAVQALAGPRDRPGRGARDARPAGWRRPIEAAAYFVVAEALTNVAKYAQASAATVGGDGRQGPLVVEVSDDGVGGAAPDAGSGLRGLADRVGRPGRDADRRQPARRGHAAARRHPAGRALSDSAKSSLGIGEDVAQLEAGGGQVGAQALDRELGADLGAQLLARREARRRAPAGRRARPSAARRAGASRSTRARGRRRRRARRRRRRSRRRARG